MSPKRKPWHEKLLIEKIPLFFFLSTNFIFSGELNLQKYKVSISFEQIFVIENVFGL